MKYKITNFLTEPPEVVAMVELESGVIRCSNANLMASFEKGILSAPPDRRLVKPDEADVFWKALPFYFSGWVRAGAVDY